MNPQSTDNLADLIDKRHRCLLQLRDLGYKQSELITAGDMGPLLRVISAKNQLIAALQSIESGLACYHDDDPDQRVWASVDARSHCAQQAKSCQCLLDEVMQLERENEQNLIERRNQVASQLQTAQAAGNARGAYQAQQLSKPQSPHKAHATPIAPLGNSSQGHQLDLQSDV